MRRTRSRQSARLTRLLPLQHKERTHKQQTPRRWRHTCKCQVVYLMKFSSAKRSKILALKWNHGAKEDNTSDDKGNVVVGIWGSSRVVLVDCEKQHGGRGRSVSLRSQFSAPLTYYGPVKLLVCATVEQLPLLICV